MDCCNSDKNIEDDKTKLNGGKMNKKIIMWIVIAVLVAGVIFLTLKAPSSASQVASSTGQVVQQASSGMVGGC